MLRNGRLTASIGILALTVGLGFPIFNGTINGNVVTPYESSSQGSVTFTAGEVRSYQYRGAYEVTLEDIFLGKTPFSQKDLPSLLQPASSQVSPERTQRTGVTGVLVMKVFSTNSRSAVVGMQLTDAQCPDEVMVNKRCHEVYSSPFLAEISREGAISFTQFSNELSLSEERKLKGIIEPLSLNLEKGEKWQSRATDSQGDAIYMYTRNGGSSEITRRKLDYLSVRNVGDFVDAGEVKDSLGVFTLGSDVSWLDTAAVTESLVLKNQGIKRVSFETSVSLRSVALTPVNLSWKDLSLPEFRSLLSSGSKRTTSRAQEERAKVTAANLKGDTRGFQKRIAELSADLSPAEIVGRTREAAQWLEANPDFVPKMPMVIARADLSEEVRSRLVYVLQKLGTESAQNALLSIVEDSVQSESTRRAALGAFAFIPITPSSEEILWQIRRGNRMERSKIFQEMATLALGGAARAWESQDRVRTDSLALQLMAELKESTQKNNTRDVETVLLALGNSGSEIARDTLEHYLTSGVDSVRRAVATAFQSFEKEPNLELIADAMMIEQNAGVREELTTVLLQHKVTEYTFAAAAQLFVEEDDKTTRLLLARYLAKAVETFPQQRAHIKALLRVETDPLIADALGTRINPQVQ